MDGMDEFDRLMRKIVDLEPGPIPFTVHLDFSAKDDEQAQYRAMQYAHAIGLLRTEIDFYRARVSRESRWELATLVFCNEPGPDPMDVCLLMTGHAGQHKGVGVSISWSDDEVPAAPDTIEGVEPDDPGDQAAES